MKLSTKYFKTDMLSGLVVFLVALPLCLGIAVATGAPPFAGIITGVIGGIVVGYLSTSNVSVSGPAAGLIAINLLAITTLGYETFLVAVVIAGLIQLTLGFARAGSISSYFPTGVIEGMLAAIGIIIIKKEIPHAIGYDKAHVMIVSSVPRLWNEDGFNKMQTARNEFLSSPIIESVSLSWGAPNFNFSPYNAKINKPGSPLDDGVVAIVSAADEHYEDVYGIDLVAGRFFFNENEPQLANQVVINESAQKALSLQPGDKLSMEFSSAEFTIAGVVKDFNFESFHKPIQPVVFVHTKDFQAFRYFSFKLVSGRLDETIGEIEQLWKKVFPNDPFVYNFTDERVAVVYQTELQLKKASVIASVLILVIILTGVVGLVSLSLARRTKEIGIRKVLGASVSNILLLVSTEYLLIMSLSFIIGIPVSLIFGRQWLDTFAYKVNLGWWEFAIPIVFLALMTLLLVVAQSVRTSLSNPVTSLRHE